MSYLGFAKMQTEYSCRHSKKKKQQQLCVYSEFSALMHYTYIVEGFSPCFNVSSAVKAPQEGVTQHIDSHRQGVHGGTVKR